MFRFFVNEKQGDNFVIPEETLRHMKVARVMNDEFICVYESIFYKCKLENNMGFIIEKINENHEFEGEVILVASLINFKKFDFVVQKATELGATKIVPMATKNISVKISKDDKKLERWNRIAYAAAEQSFRNIVPEVTSIKSFQEVMDINIDNKFIAHEKEYSKVKTSIPQNSIILIGPEGGFDQSEIQLAITKGYEIISFGKRILRAETASLFALSRIEY